MVSLLSRSPLPPLYQSAAFVSPFGRWTKELIDRREQEVGTVIDDWHDDALLRALRQALRARRAVPPEFAEAGRGAFAWRDIDVELAQLSHDSADRPEHAQGPPAETASLRTLTFRSPRLTIELEVGPDCLIGEIFPPQPAVVRVQASARPDPAIRFDEHGCFIVRPIPQTRFRLRCKTTANAEVMTWWISL
jgi:hypothetical protein